MYHLGNGQTSYKPHGSILYLGMATEILNLHYHVLW